MNKRMKERTMKINQFKQAFSPSSDKFKCENFKTNYKFLFNPFPSENIKHSKWEKLLVKKI